MILLLLFLFGAALSERTRMLILDSGSATANRVDLGDDLSNPTVTTYNIPALDGFRAVDWDYEDDRLYILNRDYTTVTSIFLNGTDFRNVTVLPRDTYVLTVEPFEKKLFASIFGGSKPAQIVSMGIDGGNMTVLRNARLEAPDMGIDYQNKYLYWTEYLCRCLFRWSYGEADAEVEKVYDRIYLKKNPRAVDFQNKLLYGDAKPGLYRFNLETRRETLIYSYDSKYSDVTVYDPKTDRIFLYNKDETSDVTVLASSGESLGQLEGVSLTPDKRKAILINPQ